MPTRWKVEQRACGCDVWSEDGKELLTLLNTELAAQIVREHNAHEAMRVALEMMRDVPMSMYKQIMIQDVLRLAKGA